MKVRQTMTNQRRRALLPVLFPSLFTVGALLFTSTLFAQETANPASDGEVVTARSAQRLDKSFRGQVKRATRSLMSALNKELKEQGLPFTTLAVLPFKALDDGARSAKVSAALAELFSTQLSSKGKVISVERGRIEGVIGELGRATKGEVSPKGAAQAGKLLGARYVLLGSITTLGSTLQVTTRLVASETGEVIKGETLRAPRTDFVSFSRDVVVTKSKMGAAFRSMLIPGWGQLYNGDKWTGYSTLFAAAGALGTAALYGYLGSEAQAKYQQNLPSTVGERKIANASYARARVALWSYALIWSASVANAYISGHNDSQVDIKAWGDLESAGVILSGQF